MTRPREICVMGGANRARTWQASLVGLVLGAGSAGVVLADIVTVTALGDGGAGSLRQAIIDANANGEDDTIHVPAGRYTLTLAGPGENAAASGDLDITEANTAIKIIGEGVAITMIDAAGIDRVFHVFPDAELQLFDITIRRGVAVGGEVSPGAGGGIHNSGIVEIVGCAVSDNMSATSDAGGGIYTTGMLVVHLSTISDNSGGTNGGGIMNQNTGTVSITQSTISGNSGGSSNGGGIYCNTGGTVTISNSTISNNTTNLDGGGISEHGGSLTITSSTITNNSASCAGGIRGVLKGGERRIGNTIIAGNTATTTGDDIFSGAYTSLGHNLIGDIGGTVTGFADGVGGDQVGGGIDAMLGFLRNNGGPTKTHALRFPSPAVDAGDNEACPATDQRGIARFFGSACDIGAFELMSMPIPAMSPWGVVVTALALLTSGVLITAHRARRSKAS